MTVITRSHPAPSGPVVSHIPKVIHLLIHFICQTFHKTSFVSITKPDPGIQKWFWDEVHASGYLNSINILLNILMSQSSLEMSHRSAQSQESHLRAPHDLVWDYRGGAVRWGVRGSGLKEASGRSWRLRRGSVALGWVVQAHFRGCLQHPRCPPMSSYNIG